MDQPTDLKQLINQRTAVDLLINKTLVRSVKDQTTEVCLPIDQTQENI